MKMRYLLLLPLLLSGCDENDLQPLATDTYTLTILDEKGKLVYDGGGSLDYYGGNEMALSMPTSRIPVAESSNFMVIFMQFEAPKTFKSAVLYERYYSLEDDFGFKAAVGNFSINRQTEDWSEGVFRMHMVSDQQSGFPMNPHPEWGERITVSGRFRFANEN